jgi:hypothetical protein
VKTKHELTVSIDEETVSLNGHWVKGEISTKTTLGELDLSSPHISKNLDVSVWLGDEGKHQIHIDQNTWTYLSGVFGDSNYSSTELLRGSFSLAELRLISSTLTQFLDGLETGEISSK